MIQSDKFDSSNMDIKKLANSTLIFIIKRLIEIIGILFLIIGILILISLISYSNPEGPNASDSSINIFLLFIILTFFYLQMLLNFLVYIIILEVK